MTNEEAIKVLEFFKGQAEKYDGSLEYINPEEVEAFSMAIEALQRSAWIPVGERLPENGFDDIVLVSVGYDMEFGRCNDKGEWLIWSFADWLHCDKVLAWMPLPEPYKEGTDDQDKTDRDPEENPGDVHR